jgi:hypothetical protein
MSGVPGRPISSNPVHHLNYNKPIPLLSSPASLAYPKSFARNPGSICRAVSSFDVWGLHTRIARKVSLRVARRKALDPRPLGFPVGGLTVLESGNTTGAAV